MSYNYERDFYGGDDYYGDMREDARDRLSETIVRSGKELGGVYGAQLQANELEQMQQARQGAVNPVLTGLAVGGSFGSPWGAAIGGGLGALSGGAGSHAANRKLGKNRGQSVLAAIGDVLSPGNALKSPMLLPAAGAVKQLMPKQNSLTNYLSVADTSKTGDFSSMSDDDINAYNDAMEQDWKFKSGG